MGCEAPGDKRGDRRTGQRLHGCGEPARGHGHRAGLPAPDGELRPDAPDRRLVLGDHRPRHPRGDRGHRLVRGVHGPPASGGAGVDLHEGPASRRPSRLPLPHTACGWPSPHRRGSPDGRAGRRRRRRCRPGTGLPRLPLHASREPARTAGALPFRRLRPQGRGRRERRYALLRPRAGRAGRHRSAHPAGQGGDRLRPRAVPAGQAATGATASAS